MRLIIKCLLSHVFQISLLIYRLMLQDDSIARAALWIQLSSLFWAWSCQAAASTLSQLSLISFIFRSVLAQNCSFCCFSSFLMPSLLFLLQSQYCPACLHHCCEPFAAVSCKQCHYVVLLLLSPSELKLEHADLLCTPIRFWMVNITRHVLQPLEQQICPASPIAS